jgi:Spy/CpxP family protein refolding chaperone
VLSRERDQPSRDERKRQSARRHLASQTNAEHEPVATIKDGDPLGKGKTMNWKQTAIAAATALSLVAVTAYAQGSLQPVHGYGGMMGGYSQGYGSGEGRDYHMGPGMMGGYGGYGMGPGMMGGYGGYGMGPGMMGGYGMGPGMLGGDELGAIGRLNLDDEQRSQITKIEGDLRRKNWELMGEMHDEMATLRDLGSASGKRDRTAILAANKRMTELRQQMLENSLDATDKAEALLTPEQRERVRRLAQSRFDSESN